MNSGRGGRHADDIQDVRVRIPYDLPERTSEPRSGSRDARRIHRPTLALVPGNASTDLYALVIHGISAHRLVEPALTPGQLPALGCARAVQPAAVLRSVGVLVAGACYHPIHAGRASVLDGACCPCKLRVHDTRVEQTSTAAVDRRLATSGGGYDCPDSYDNLRAAIRPALQGNGQRDINLENNG